MANQKTFNDFFKQVAGGKIHSPYPYQERLGGGDAGRKCESLLIDIPTGLGKTAAVVMAWLWNRVILERDDWPRRLVYCLPMRTLVEQTRDNVKEWLERANDYRCSDRTEWLAKNSPVILMGGEKGEDDQAEWDLYPEKEAILIGTQDMLLSRALNRGYGMSRYRWPMHFGLLNNDCLWVLDETQLMGSGLWTSAQLDWMRERRFKPVIPVKTWWMSATLGGAFLRTSDRQREEGPNPGSLSLSDEELRALSILKARKQVGLVMFKGAQKQSDDEALKEVARLATTAHVPGALSMLVCNRVAIAQTLHALIASVPPESRPEVLLLHSRFRPADRKEVLEKILNFEADRKAGKTHSGLVLVTTQVVEAGFDVSATKLWTQLAPWSSLVQRLGRLNRDGRSNDDAQAFVFEMPGDKKDPLPYEKVEIDAARKIVAELAKLSLTDPKLPIRDQLRTLASGSVSKFVIQALEPNLEPYPRALDVHGLFSTEPDVFGGFTDVSPWVRNAKANADVTVFWREFDDNEKAANAVEDGPPFNRDEGCSVAVFRLKEFLSGSRRAYHWNPKSQQWESMAIGDICPGMTLLLSGGMGGYDRACGWTGKRGGDLGQLPPPGPFSQRDEEDLESESNGGWVTLKTHLEDAKNFAERITISLGKETNTFRPALVQGAALHDIGKSLEQWQRKLLELHQVDDGEAAKTLWAKAPKVKGRRFLPGFRHEAASALAMWNRYYREEGADFPALAIYLVAAHHGKARTVLAARPRVAEPNVCGIPKPDGTDRAFSSLPMPWPEGWRMDFTAAQDGASGVFDTDGNFIFEAPGWSGLVADLLGSWEANAPTRTCGAVPESEPAALGPFALAYLETLLRAADGQASKYPSNVCFNPTKIT